jgi:putative DNA-binding protein
MKSMPSLSEAQRAFAAAIIGRQENALRDWIVAPADLDAASALDVYRNNVFGNYRNALQDTYPAIWNLVGEAFFNRAADDYASSHPSRSGNLNDFGGELWSFLAAWAPAGGLTYLPDVARLEWAIERAFHAADALPVDLHGLAGVPPEALPGLHFELHPACCVVCSPYPIWRIWQVSQPGFAGDQQVALTEGADQLLVTRRGGTVEIEPVSNGERAMLEGFAAGSPLQQAHACALAAEPGFDLGAFLRHHALGGTFVGFHTPAEE